MSSLVRAVVELFRSRALYLISKNGSQRLEIGLIVTGRVWLTLPGACAWFCKLSLVSASTFQFVPSRYS